VADKTEHATPRIRKSKLPITAGDDDEVSVNIHEGNNEEMDHDSVKNR
jgi:hypothetical protein